MTKRERQPAAGAAGSVFGPVLLTNAGVLLVFLFGPNSQHHVVALTYGGAAAALAGAFFIVRALASRRKAQGSFGLVSEFSKRK